MGYARAFAGIIDDEQVVQGREAVNDRDDPVAREWTEPLRWAGAGWSLVAIFT
jgi:hypothetical protein